MQAYTVYVHHGDKDGNPFVLIRPHSMLMVTTSRGRALVHAAEYAAKGDFHRQPVEYDNELVRYETEGYSTLLLSVCASPLLDACD